MPTRYSKTVKKALPKGRRSAAKNAAKQARVYKKSTRKAKRLK